MDVSSICLSPASSFAGGALGTRPLYFLPTNNTGCRQPSLAGHRLCIVKRRLSSSTLSTPFRYSGHFHICFSPAKATEHDLITETTDALRAHLQKFRSTILEKSTKNEDKIAPRSESEWSSSTSSSSSSSESSESEEEESPQSLNKQRNNAIIGHLEGCNHVSEREDGEFYTGSRRSSSAERVEVCTGRKCEQRGSVAVLGELKKQVGIRSDVFVGGCKCLGKCKYGPNVRVSSGEGEAAPSVLSGVHLENVDVIVGALLARKGITGIATPVLPRSKQGNLSF